MAEAELSADLFSALLGGVQTNKNVEQYYRRYEDQTGNLEEVAKQFDTIMSYIGTIYPPQDIASTNWSRVPLFYTLFTVIGHCLYGLDGLDPNLRVPITDKLIGKMRVQLDEVTSQYDEATKTKSAENGSVPENLEAFIDRSRRRTADTASRIYRANYVCEKLKATLD